MKHNPYEVIKNFEEIVADYCGSSYAVAVDNATNGLFLCMKYLKIENQEITIPARTFMSVPCAIIHAGNKVNFDKNHPAIKGKKLKGQYRLDPFPIWDSALTFKKDMYIPGELQCLSLGWNYYMLPEIAARGAVLMLGIKDNNEDLALEYQDLSIYKVYTEDNF